MSEYQVKDAEQLADQYKFMFDYLMGQKGTGIKLSKETLNYYRDVSVMLRLYYEMFFKKGMKILDLGCSTGTFVLNDPKNIKYQSDIW